MNEREATSRRFDIKTLQHQLETQFFGAGNRLVFLPIVDSTNTLAMQLAQDGSEEGVVVLTDSQTAGKGRLGRRWVDLSGCNVLSSTVLRPQFPPYFLVMMASLAVVDAITDTCGVIAAIKWPNDVLLRDRKVAGILIETSHDRKGQMIAIVGIGINVNGDLSQLMVSKPLQTQTELATTATTLQTVCGHAVSREMLVAHLLQHLEKYYLALQQETQNSVVDSSISQMIREKWKSRLSTLGRAIQVRQGGTILSGIAEDVNDTGELLLHRHSGERVSITWGDVGYPTE